jgi:hypothetical protein
MQDSPLCMLCGEPCDQAGRFCFACVGPVPSGSPGNVDVGTAQVGVMRALQWPVNAGLLATVGAAAVCAAGLATRLPAAVTDARHGDDTRTLDGLRALSGSEQHLVHAGAAAVAVMGVLWLVWWAVAYANLRPLGLRPRQGEWWAVIAWLVPFAHLVVPQRVADELWRGSDPLAPLGWQPARYARPAAVVRLWWDSWCAAAVLLVVAQGSLVFFVRDAGAAPVAVRAAGAAVVDLGLMATAVLTAVAGLTAAHLVAGVTSRQRERARILSGAGLSAA